MRRTINTDKTRQNVVNEIVASILNCPITEILPEKRLCYDLLADSLALMDIVHAIEEQFDFEFKNDYLAKVSEVKDLYQVVESCAIAPDST